MGAAVFSRISKGGCVSTHEVSLAGVLLTVGQFEVTRGGECAAGRQDFGTRGDTRFDRSEAGDVILEWLREYGRPSGQFKCRFLALASNRMRRSLGEVFGDSET